MYEIEERTLDVNGFNIAYTQTGSKYGRVLFCVHGLLSNGRDYDFLARRLAEQGYRVIAMDLPGRGKSGHFVDGSLYSLPSYMPFCHALASHVSGGKTFDWLGVSLGGMLGMALSNAEGIGMGRLILVDVGAEIPASALDLVTKLAKAQSVFDRKDAAIEALKQRCGAWGIAEDKIWDHLIAHNILKAEGGAYRFHYDPKIAAPMSDENETIEFWELWSQIKQPIFLVRGGKSILMPTLIAHKMKLTYQGASFDDVVFEDCGHVPNLMQVDHIDALVSWLRQ